MWIQLHDNVIDHPKTHRIAKELKISRVQVLGHLAALWTWTLRIAPDGDLSQYDEADIEIGAHWEGEPGIFVAALTDRYLDFRDNGFSVHDWFDYAGSLKAALRKKLQRARSLENSSVSRDSPATVAGLSPDCPRTVVDCPAGEERRGEEKRGEKNKRDYCARADSQAAPDSPTAKKTEDKLDSPTAADQRGEVDPDASYTPQRIEAVFAAQGWVLGQREFAAINPNSTNPPPEYPGRDLAAAIEAAKRKQAKKAGYAITCLLNPADAPQQRVRDGPRSRRNLAGAASHEEWESARRQMEKNQQEKKT